jgi:hypothetical protein
MSVTGRVQNGQVVLAEPLDLPDGSEVEVVLPDDMTADERAELEAEIEAGYAEVERGEVVDAREVLRQLAAKK